MRFSTSVLGIVATAILTFGIASGTIAADSPPSVMVGATFTGGNCTGSLASENPNFGTWTYSGTTMRYELTSGTGSVALVGSITEGDPSGCDVTVTFFGLDGDDDPTNGVDISLEHFSAVFNGATIDDLGTGVFAWTDVHTETVHASLTLESYPANLKPGTYAGTITLSFSNTA